MTLRRSLVRQTGSIPLALLALIVLSGVSAALFLTVRYGQVSSARDRDVNQAIQVADAGIQEAFVRIAAGEFEDTAVGETVLINGDVLVVGSSGRGSYAWQAVRTGSDSWSVRSSGEVGDSELVVEARMGVRSQFDFGIWGTSSLKIQQGGVDLSNAANQPVVIGTSGNANLHNHIITEITLEDENGNPVGSINLECYTANADGDCEQYGIQYVDTSVEFPDLAAEAYEPGGDCDPPGTDDESLRRYSRDGRDIEYHRDPYIGQFPLERGTTYCFPSVTFPSGDHWLDDAEGPAPVGVGPEARVIINVPPFSDEDGRDAPGLTVEGTGNGQNSSRVNWYPRNSAIDSLETRASDLIIQLGERREVVFPNNYTRVAAAIYAPLSRCDYRAQMEFFGAFVCFEFGHAPSQGNSSNNNSNAGGGGGFTFVYDPTLSDLTMQGRFSIEYWNQESTNSSGLGFLD